MRSYEYRDDQAVVSSSYLYSNKETSRTFQTVDVTRGSAREHGLVPELTERTRLVHRLYAPLGAVEALDELGAIERVINESDTV